MWLEIVLCLLALFSLLYWKVTKNYNFWSSKGVYQLKPSFPFGSMWAMFSQSRHFNDEFLSHINEDTKDLPYYGVYFLSDPVLIIKDADMAKQILVKSFDHFVDRNMSQMDALKESTLVTDQIWMQQLTSAGGEPWKKLRMTFTPIFSSGKMKGMMKFMQEMSSRLVQEFESNASKSQDIELKTALGKYSMDTIATCAFGVDAQAFSNDKSKFVEYAAAIFKQQLRDGLKQMLLFLPGGVKIMNLLGISLFKVKETDFFQQVVMDSIKHRRESKAKRGDLIDLMLDAIKGVLEEESEESGDQFHNDAKLKVESGNIKKEHHHLDEMSIVATAIVILVAGYDTTGTMLAYACYQLSKKPHVQEKLREEVENILGDDRQRELNYDDLQSMTYLDQIICETLRFHNPIGILTRNCTKDFQFPGTDLSIQKGTNIWINIMAIHMNPTYYPNPTEFDPERFSKEERAKRNP